MERATSRQQVEALLSQLSISYKTHEHNEVLTMEELEKAVQGADGAFTKNLFVKDKKQRHYLLVLRHNLKPKLAYWANKLGATGTTFADEQSLNQFLGVKQGAVSGLSIVNDNENKVKLVIDLGLKEFPKWLMHPNVNTATTEIAQEDFLKIAQHAKHDINWVYVTEEEAGQKKFGDEVIIQEKQEVQEKQPAQKASGKTETKLKIFNKKSANFSQWYGEVLIKAELIEYYEVSGCYILRPWAYSIWERIQQKFDTDIKSIGVQNCYFPMFVSERALNTEKEHIQGFEAEVAWVTKAGKTDLAEKIAIRPTSETIMYPSFSKWIKSHRDLPLLLNQWTNIVRWEFKDPTPFIRTREFLWQEGHTAHATFEEAEQMVYTILDFYESVYRDLLAIPVIKGIKSEKEKFAGGHHTTCVETMVYENGRSIQAATSHHLGQNFAKMFKIEFIDENSQKQLAWQTSWGLSTRSIGTLIMVHGDDKGLVLPPRVAPIQVVLIPILYKEQQNNEIVEKLKQINKFLLSQNVRTFLDDKTNNNPGWKFNHWEQKGVPLRIEMGPQDFQSGTITIVRRDNGEKQTLPEQDVIGTIPGLLETIQSEMFNKTDALFKSRVKKATTWQEFMQFVNSKNFVLTPWCEQTDCETATKVRSAAESAQLSAEEQSLTGSAKTLCLPIQQDPIEPGTKCFQCGADAKKIAMWGRSY